MLRTKKPNYYHIGSLEKGINLLKILAAGGAMSLEEIATEARMDRSGCHRYLLTFRDLGLLSKNATSGYRLTTGLFEIAMTYINRLGIRQIARPFMEELSQKYNETVNLVVRNGDHVVFLNKIESSHQYRMEIAIGTRHPIYCTAQGKAIIAFRPENERDAFCDEMKNLRAFSVNTITSPKAFKEEIAAIRKRGFAINRDEYFAGMSGVAAPVSDYTGFAVYSVSVAGPSDRMPMSMLLRIGEDLKQVCDQISAILGRTA
jgi:IclR family transcriptional regulator, KDG regulon repressor